MSTSSIDPRIRARRIAVQRDEGRKRLRKLGIASGVVAAGAALWGVTLTPLLDVDHLRVSGAGRTGEAAVLGAAGIDRGDALLTADVGAAADRLADLPWVQTVEVSRRWPGTIEIDLVERRPSAIVPARGGGWLLLDATGRQLAVQEAPEPGALTIEVPPVEPEIGAQLVAGAQGALELAGTIPPSMRDQLLALAPVAGGAVEGRVRLRDGGDAVVLFGRPTQAPAKWLALLGVLEQAEPRGVATIDVRVPSAPALTRR